MVVIPPMDSVLVFTVAILLISRITDIIHTTDIRPITATIAGPIMADTATMEGATTMVGDMVADTDITADPTGITARIHIGRTDVIRAFKSSIRQELAVPAQSDVTESGQ